MIYSSNKDKSTKTTIHCKSGRATAIQCFNHRVNGPQVILKVHQKSKLGVKTCTAYNLTLKIG